jgi:SAM-dependent MidA family methyltransferase
MKALHVRDTSIFVNFKGIIWAYKSIGIKYIHFLTDYLFAMQWNINKSFMKIDASSQRPYEIVHAAIGP